MAFSADNEVKAMYNHWDSYPTGLGETIVTWIKNLDEAGIEDAIAKFKALVKVDPDVPPTAEQREKLLGYADLRVSTQSLDDWYVLLRETQGDPQKTLDAGFYEDGFNCGGDEFGYLIDLTKRMLWIFTGNSAGFRTSLDEDGTLVGMWTFEQIWAGEADMATLEESL